MSSVIQYGGALRIIDASGLQQGDILKIFVEDTPTPPTPPTPEGSFNITLYQNTAENERLDKTNYLTSVGTISGALRDETSITDMTISIEYNSVPNFNYVYIPSFNRYYYVTDIVSVRKNLWEISLSVDVLMTYKNAIRNLSAFVDRNENVNNADIIDEKRVIEQGYDVETIEIQNALFKDDRMGSYLITGLGFVAIEGGS